jgi:hypothetical protein
MSNFCYPRIKRHLKTSLITFSCAALLSYCVLFCVVHMDVGLVVLSCFYVPHWYVCVNPFGLVECVSQLPEDDWVRPKCSNSNFNLLSLSKGVIVNKVAFKTELNVYKWCINATGCWNTILRVWYCGLTSKIQKRQNLEVRNVMETLITRQWTQQSGCCWGQCCLGDPRGCNKKKHARQVNMFLLSESATSQQSLWKQSAEDPSKNIIKDWPVVIICKHF